MSTNLTEELKQEAQRNKEALEQYGWQRATTTRKQLYTHKQFPGHVFRLRSIGIWVHQAFAMDVAYSAGTVRLLEHLQQFHAR